MVISKEIANKKLCKNCFDRNVIGNNIFCNKCLEEDYIEREAFEFLGLKSGRR